MREEEWGKGKGGTYTCCLIASFRSAEVADDAAPEELLPVSEERSIVAILGGCEGRDGDEEGKIGVGQGSDK